MKQPDPSLSYRVRTSFGGHQWRYSEPMSYEEAQEWLKQPAGDRLTVRIRREIVPAEEGGAQ